MKGYNTSPHCCFNHFQNHKAAAGAERYEKQVLQVVSGAWCLCREVISCTERADLPGVVQAPQAWRDASAGLPKSTHRAWSWQLPHQIHVPQVPEQKSAFLLLLFAVCVYTQTDTDTHAHTGPHRGWRRLLVKAAQAWSLHCFLLALKQQLSTSFDGKWD